MSAGLQISPTIDTNFLFSLWPNQIIKIALIKLTDTQRGKKTVCQEQLKWGKSKQTRKARCGQKIGLKLISLVFCFSFFVTFPTNSLLPPNIYLIDFRMVASPRYEFPSPSDHAPQSSGRYAAPKIHCHLKKERKSGH